VGELRKRWFVTGLCVLAAVIFFGALVFSSMNYVRVIDARENIVLAGAVESAEELTNGSLRVGIVIELRNPSKIDLSISTVRWHVKLDISDMGGDAFLPIATVYKSSVEPIYLSAGSTMEYEYEAVVSDASVLGQIQEYIDYSAAGGDEYTLETAPYIHDFRVTAWLGDFSHDYQYSGEVYLNDMIRIELSYSDGEYA